MSSSVDSTDLEVSHCDLNSEDINQIQNTGCTYCGSYEISTKGCVTNCANCGNEYHSCGD